MIWKTKFKKVPLYDEFKYRILLTDNPVECLKELGVHYDGSNFMGMALYDKGGFEITLIFDRSRLKDKVFAQRLIAHECFHVTCNIMRLICTSLTDSSSEEPYAYLLDWLVGEVNKTLLV